MYSCNYVCYFTIRLIIKIISVINKEMGTKHSWNYTDGGRMKYSDKPIILKKVMQIQRGTRCIDLLFL